MENLPSCAKDGQGHIFLDLPAAPVKVLLDALRMRQLRQQQGKTLQLRQGGSTCFQDGTLWL